MRKKILSPYWWIGCLIVSEYRFSHVDSPTKIENNNSSLLFKVMLSGSISMTELNILINDEQKNSRIASYIIFGLI